MAILDLFKPKWKHSDWKVRTIAIQKVTDQKILTVVAKNDENSQARKAAVEKIIDQKVLAEIAKNDKHAVVRKAAIQKVNNQKVLADVVNNDKDAGVRKVALENITDYKILTSMGKHFSSTYFLFECEYQGYSKSGRDQHVANAIYSLFDQYGKSNLIGKIDCSFYRDSLDAMIGFEWRCNAVLGLKIKYFFECELRNNEFTIGSAALKKGSSPI